jgi:hypothetical protein
MSSKLSEFAANNRRKDRLIERGLKMLTKYAVNPTHDYLCLVNPKQDAEGCIDWTVVGKSVPADEREAVVTRRVLAGYLPIGCLLRSPDWGMILDKSFVPEELHAVYVAFARLEMTFIAATIDGKMDKNDSWTTPVDWSDRSYPGQPVKPRKPGTIKIDVDIQNRSVRITSEPICGYMDLPIEDDQFDGGSDEHDALYVALDIIEAHGQVQPPKGAVRGDVYEVSLIRADATPKLLTRISAEGNPNGLTGEFGMGGIA